MSERTADDVIRSNACNTYVMSCHINKDDLYEAMRRDIGIMCDQYATLKAQNDGLLAAAKGLLDMVRRDNAGFPLEYELRVATEEYAANAIANAERPTGC